MVTIEITEGMLSALKRLSEARREQQIAYYDHHYEDVQKLSSYHDVRLRDRRLAADALAEDALRQVGWHFERAYRDKE